MKKNIASLVLSIIGAFFGLIGGILWAACADFVSGAGQVISGEAGGATLYLALFIVLGIGGAVLSIVGGIQSYSFKKGGLTLSLFGFLFQVGMLIVACVAVGGFSFVLNLCTLMAIVLLLVQTIMAARKPKN